MLLRGSILVGALLVVGIAAACSTTADTPPQMICTPGNYVYCRCQDRSEGTKLCHADGLGFDPCDDCLSGSDGDDPDEPDPEGGTDPDMDAATDDAADVLVPTDAPPGTVRPVAGELLVTEVMYDPSGAEPDDEWFEVYSTAKTTVNFNGMFLKDGAGRVHVLAATPTMDLPPNQYMLFVRNQGAALSSGLPAAKILAEYGTGDAETAGIILTNAGTGAISIFDGATQIVSVAFGEFGFTQASPGGSSIQIMQPNVSMEQEAASWCLSANEYPGQPATKSPKDDGTPGAASDCP